ncbi:MAG: hypothetical protein M3451_01530 [Chloroflexota bacterium]|nr:hypothetical protein [Chloroflexota bacterium]
MGSWLYCLRLRHTVAEHTGLLMPLALHPRNRIYLRELGGVLVGRANGGKLAAL